MVINPATQTPYWYHSTTRNKVQGILKEGLACIHSMAGHCMVPWTYVSPTPDPEKLDLIVDLSEMNEEDVSWSSYPSLLRVHVPISPDKIKPFVDITTNG